MKNKTLDFVLFMFYFIFGLSKGIGVSKSVFNLFTFVSCLFISFSAKAETVITNQALLDKALDECVYGAIAVTVISIFIIFAIAKIFRRKSIKIISITTVIIANLLFMFVARNMYMASYLEHGTNKQVKEFFYNSYNPNFPFLWFGDSLFASVYFLRDEDVIGSLIEQGVDVNNYGWFYKKTPLSHAVIVSSPAVVKVLLDNGAGVNHADRKGITPLMSLVALRKSKTITIAKILLEKGANPYLKNHNGKSAYDIAKNMRKNELISLFEKHKK